MSSGEFDLWTKNQIFAQNANFQLKIDYFWVQMPQNENF